MNYKIFIAPQHRDANTGGSQTADELFMSSGIGQRLSLDMDKLSHKGNARVLSREADERDARRSGGRSDHAQSAAKATICSVLNQCIADCLDLQSQCRQARWHLAASAHLEQRSICTQANHLIEHHVDLLGHRVIQLGGGVESTVRQVADRSGLSESTAMVDDPQTPVDVLVDALGLAFGLASGAMRDDCAELIERGDAISHNLLDQAAVSLEQCLELLELSNPDPIVPSERRDGAG